MTSELYVTHDDVGRIIGEYALPAGSLAPDGAVPVGSGVSWRTHWVENGSVVAYTAEQLSAIQNPPSPHHIWSPLTGWQDPRTPETEWPLVRSRRNQLLTASDWTQLPDVPLATKDAWAVYRQALRDITQQADPFNIVWPVPPA